MFDITKCPIIDGYKRCKARGGIKVEYEEGQYDE